MNVKLKDLNLNFGTQTRVHINEDTVEEYSQAFLNGAIMPPVVIYFDSCHYHVGDGFHRILAATRAGIKEIQSELRHGTRIDALKFALGANRDHGLRRTNADKRNCVEIALREFPDQTHRVIAEMCGVSHTLVNEIRGEIQTVQVEAVSNSTVDESTAKTETTPDAPTTSSKNSPPPPPPPARRIGRDGKSYPALPPPPPPPAPKAKAPAPAEPVVVDKIGRAIPAPLLPIWDRAQEVNDLLSAISGVKCSVEHAQDDKDKLFAECNFSSILGHLKNAYSQLKVALPYAVCPACQGKTFKTCTACCGRGLVSEYRWDTAFPKDIKEMIIRGIK